MKRHRRKVLAFYVNLLSLSLLGCYAAFVASHYFNYRDLRNASLVVASVLFSILREIKPKS